MVSCVYKMDRFTAWRSSGFVNLEIWKLGCGVKFAFSNTLYCMYNFNIQYIPSKIYIDERSADPHESFTAAVWCDLSILWKKFQKATFGVKKTKLLGGESSSFLTTKNDQTLVVMVVEFYLEKIKTVGVCMSFERFSILKCENPDWMWAILLEELCESWEPSQQKTLQ